SRPSLDGRSNRRTEKEAQRLEVVDRAGEPNLRRDVSKYRDTAHRLHVEILHAATDVTLDLVQHTVQSTGDGPLLDGQRGRTHPYAASRTQPKGSDGPRGAAIAKHIDPDLADADIDVLDVHGP